MSKFFRLLAVALLFSQLVFSIIISPISGVRDQFPLFRWDLFARQHQIRQAWAVETISLDGNILDEPKLHYDLPVRGEVDFLFIHDRLERWSRETEASSESAEATRRVIADKLYEGFRSATYKFVSFQADPFEFYRSRKRLRTDFESEVYDFHQ